MRKPLLRKNNILSSILVPAVAAIFLLTVNCAFGVINGDAFTLTGDSVSTASPISEIGSENIQFFNTTATAVKITGTDSFLSSGGSGSITADAHGTVSAASGDLFSLGYDFTLGLTGTGTVSFTLTGTVTVSTILGPFSDQVFNQTSATPLQGPATQEYTGTVSAAAPLGLAVPAGSTWDANLVVNWDDAADGDTLTVTVPSNSIDLAVAPPAPAVPEPTTLPLLALGLLALVGGRRFLPRPR